jgi:probable HAF family extracellular repeat protein
LPGGGGPIWISDSGLVLSNAFTGLIDPMTGAPEQHGVLFTRNGSAVDIGTLDDGNESFGGAVNNVGSVVGVASNSIPDPFSFLSFFGYQTQTRAVLWQNGVLTDLGTLGGPDAVAANVNERGQVAGFSYTDTTPTQTTGIPTVHPFLWEHGRMIDLGTLGGVFAVPGSVSGEGTVLLNNRGQVVGTSYLAGDQTWHPFLSEHGALKDLGTLGGSTGQATCINDAGEIVGEADLPGDVVHEAFLWKNGLMRDLGNLGQSSFAFSVNLKSQVVGRSHLDDVTTHAFLWELGGPMIDLNTLIPVRSTLELTDAFEINDRGEIAGMGVPPGCSSEDECGHAFILIPCHSADAQSCENDSGHASPSIQNPALKVPATSTQAHRSMAEWRARLAQRYQIPGFPPHKRR